MVRRPDIPPADRSIDPGRDIVPTTEAAAAGNLARVAAQTTRRPIVLAFANGYLPGFRAGGPVRSLANLVERLGDEFDFRIVCPDCDFGECAPYPGIVPDAWNAVGQAHVFYATRPTRSWRGLRRLLRRTPHDVLYLNSFFHPVFTLQPLLLRALRQVPRKPLIVAPRGEFSPGALGIKPLRKKLYTALARYTRLYSSARWQASTAREVGELREAFGVSTELIYEARDLAARAAIATGMASGVKAPHDDETRPLRVCFLSRITPMKNVDFALRVLSRVHASVHFSVLGPVEAPDYWQLCEQLIDALPANVTVERGGTVDPSRVGAVIAQHDVLFVPTRGENFGHVFIEAWSAGVPALVSDCTPWRGLRSKGIGWDLPLSNPEAFVRALEELATMGAAQKEEMRQASFAFARGQAEAPEVLEANRRLFLDTISTSAISRGEAR